MTQKMEIALEAVKCAEDMNDAYFILRSTIKELRFIQRAYAKNQTTGLLIMMLNLQAAVDEMVGV